MRKLDSIFYVQGRRVRVVVEPVRPQCRKHVWVFDEGGDCLACGLEVEILGYVE